MLPPEGGEDLLAELVRPFIHELEVAARIPFVCDIVQAAREVRGTAVGGWAIAVSVRATAVREVLNGNAPQAVGYLYKASQNEVGEYKGKHAPGTMTVKDVCLRNPARLRDLRA